MVIDPKQTRDYTGETLDIRSRTMHERNSTGA